MIDSVTDLRVFEKVVSLGSMSAAADALNLSLAVVSKRLATMEARLGVRLIHRTTRKQSLTPEGQLFHERSLRILGEVQDAEALMAGTRDTVSGVLSITAPRSFGRQYVAPLVAAFAAEHPALSVRLLLGDENVDLVEGGIDIAFRFGTLADSSMSARQVAPNYRILCAAPSYIARHGMPQSLADLGRAHACIVCGNNVMSQWTFRVDGEVHAVKVRGTHVVNDGEAAQALVLAGAGVVYKSIWDVGHELEAGRLVRVLPAYGNPGEGLYVVVPHGRTVAPRVKLFSAFATARLRSAWKWDAEVVPAGPVRPRRRTAT